VTPALEQGILALTIPSNVTVWATAKKDQDGEHALPFSDGYSTLTWDLANLPDPPPDPVTSTAAVCAMTISSGMLSTGALFVEGVLAGVGTMVAQLAPAQNATITDAAPVNGVKVDLRIDSNNDGSVTDADLAAEGIGPGKLLHWNSDNDDEDEDEDRDNEDDVIPGGDDDLQELWLLVQEPFLTLTTCRLRLSETPTDTIRVYTSREKGTDSLVDLAAAEWTVPFLPSRLYVEGYFPNGAFALVLQYVREGKVLFEDTVNGAVLTTSFEESAGTVYGFDSQLTDGTRNPEVNSMAYNATTNVGGYGCRVPVFWNVG